MTALRRNTSDFATRIFCTAMFMYSLHVGATQAPIRRVNINSRIVGHIKLLVTLPTSLVYGADLFLERTAAAARCTAA